MASSLSSKPTTAPLVLQCPRSASNHNRLKLNTRRKAYRHTLIQSKASNFFLKDGQGGGGPKRCHRGGSPLERSITVGAPVGRIWWSRSVEAWLRGRRCRGTGLERCVASGSTAVVPSKLVEAKGRRCRGHKVHRRQAAPPSCLGSFGWSQERTRVALPHARGDEKDPISLVTTSAVLWLMWRRRWAGWAGRRQSENWWH
jgi:hypothetical protein